MLARLISLFALGISSAAVAEPQTLKAIAKWRADFEDAQCVAARDSGTPATPVTIAIKRPPIGDELQLSVFTARDRSGDSRQVNAAIAVNDDQPVATTFLSYDPPTGTRHVYRLNLRADSVDPVSKSTSLRLVVGTDFDRRFAEPMIEPALKVLDSCISDLREAWNIGANGNRKPAVQKPASASGFAKLFTSRDLPSVGIGTMYTGSVGIVLLIDEQGKIADCTVSETSGGAALDAQSCAVPIRFAKFKPAIGTNGRPVRDFYVYRVPWRFGMEVLNKPGKGE